jgi:signal peptidase II
MTAMRYPAIAAAVSAVLVDQISKQWVERTLALHQPVEILPTLSLFRTYNSGIAFSMFARLPDWTLIIFTLAIVAGVAWLWARLETHRNWARFGFALILGGALGNLIDRIVLGHVVDFILFHVHNWSFAVFNLADSFITIGAGLIILDEFLESRRRARSAGH